MSDPTRTEHIKRPMVTHEELQRSVYVFFFYFLYRIILIMYSTYLISIKTGEKETILLFATSHAWETANVVKIDPVR